MTRTVALAAVVFALLAGTGASAAPSPTRPCASGGPATTAGWPAPFSLHLFEGGGLSPSSDEVRADGRTLLVLRGRGGRMSRLMVHPPPSRWRAFRAELGRAGLARLRRHYSTCAPVTDGPSWSLALTLADGRRVRADGYFVWPAPLSRVDAALGRLAGADRAGRPIL